MRNATILSIFTRLGMFGAPGFTDVLYLDFPLEFDRIFRCGDAWFQLFGLADETVTIASIFMSIFLTCTSASGANSHSGSSSLFSSLPDSNKVSVGIFPAAPQTVSRT